MNRKINSILGSFDDRSKRISMAQESLRAFLIAYLGRSITYPMAEFHHKIIDLLENAKKNLVLVAFRGSGKSTLATLAYAIWSIIGLHEKKFVVIVAQTEDKARQLLKNIKDALLTLELLRNDFGSFEAPRDEWRANAINIPRFKARIAVVSVGQNIRGYIYNSHRPDLMIFDDIEDTQSAKTKEVRDKTFHWLTREAFPAGDKNTRVIMVGNKVHEDASVLRLKEMIEQEKWAGVYREYPIVDSNGKILWPGKYPNIAAVEQEKKRIGNENAFRREYLLEIIPDEGQVVFKEWLQFYDVIPDHTASNFRFAALGVDPAIGEGKDNDYTAIVRASVFGRGASRRIYIYPNPTNKRMGFPETLSTIKSAAHTMDYSVVPRIFVEAVAYQSAIVHQLKSEGYIAEPFLVGREDKRARLEAITSLIQSGHILFPKKGVEALIDQLLEFGVAKHDDLVDALTTLIHMTIKKESVSPPKGYTQLIYDNILRKAYTRENIAFAGEKKFGVVTMGPAREHAVIVLRADNVAKILVCEKIDRRQVIASRIVDLVCEYDGVFSAGHIAIDLADGGEEICEALKRNSRDKYISPEYRSYQRYGVRRGDSPLSGSGTFANLESESYWQLKKWLEEGGKLVGFDEFDSLPFVGYTNEQDSKIKIVSRDVLAREGVDIAIADALSLTFATRILKRNASWSRAQRQDRRPLLYI